MIKYKDFLLEYKKEDRLLIETLYDYFTIGFEIELDSLMQKESWPLYPSRKNKTLIERYKKSFPNFSQKYDDRISLHADETLPLGIEIVNSTTNMKIYPETEPNPFNNFEDTVQYIKDFFADYNNQKEWIFNKKTSIHVNIGTVENMEWNIVKGIMMLSDDYSFKGIEDRKTSRFCESLKNKLKKYLIKYFKNPEKYGKRVILDAYETDVYNIENGIIEILLKKPIINHGLSEYLGINLSAFLLNEDNKYAEFRHIGGSNVTEELLIEKLKYYCYIVYLMTSDYRNKEYIHKLLSFMNKCRNEN
jgi:hypothetical protein